MEGNKVPLTLKARSRLLRVLFVRWCLSARCLLGILLFLGLFQSVRLERKGHCTLNKKAPKPSQALQAQEAPPPYVLKKKGQSQPSETLPSIPALFIFFLHTVRMP